MSALSPIASGQKRRSRPLPRSFSSGSQLSACVPSIATRMALLGMRDAARYCATTSPVAASSEKAAANSARV